MQQSVLKIKCLVKGGKLQNYLGDKDEVRQRGEEKSKHS